MLKEILLDSLAAARKLGVNYAELRAVDVKREHVEINQGVLSGYYNEISTGVAVRLLVAGFWGFAAAPVQDASQVLNLVDKAFSAARAAAATGQRPTSLSSTVAQKGTYHTPVKQDPFSVSIEDKFSLLLEVDRALERDGIVGRRAWLDFRSEDKTLVTSMGTVVEQTLTQSGGGFAVTAKSGRVGRQKSWPGPGGRWFGGGFETVAALDMPGRAPAVAEEAQALCEMPSCPRGVYDVILTGQMLAQTLHATWGHLLELDNFLARPAGSQRGISRQFLSSPCVNLVADATLPGGAGTYGFDDEGVRGQSTILMQEGEPVGFMAGREAAARVGKFSSGSMRAASWDVPPLVRTSNLSLQPGYGTLSDLVNQVDRGILLTTCAGISLDPDRNCFRLVAESGRLIQGGRLTGLVPAVECISTTRDFWNSCAAVAGPEEWELWGLEQGKGAPQQLLPVGAGVPPTLFRRIKAGGLQ